MFESLVGSARVDEEGQRELMNVTKTLVGQRVDDVPLQVVVLDELENRTPNFVIVLQDVPQWSRRCPSK
jgi:hypothetical protein